LLYLDEAGVEISANNNVMRGEVHGRAKVDYLGEADVLSDLVKAWV
jgi:hypothetical protein